MAEAVHALARQRFERKKLQEAWRKRPARVQVEDTGRQYMSAEHTTGGNYNIWYNRDFSEGRHRQVDRGPAETRCDSAKDAGRTRGSNNSQAYLCYRFARGCCHLGEKCSFLHDIPSEEFEKDIPVSRDCFGRDRHETNRDDRGGVGSFSATPQVQRTLYIGRVGRAGNTPENIRKHFGEWGELDDVRCFPDRGFAFVRYHLRTAAEFAKVAMAQQAVSGRDVINIRWASEDPNASAYNKQMEEARQQLINAIENKLAHEQDAAAQGPTLALPEGTDPQALLEQSRQREALAMQWAATYENYAQHAADQAVQAQMNTAAAEEQNQAAASWNSWATYYANQAQRCKQGHVPDQEEVATFYQSIGQEAPAASTAASTEATPATASTATPATTDATATPTAAISTSGLPQHPGYPQQHAYPPGMAAYFYQQQQQGSYAHPNEATQASSAESAEMTEAEQRDAMAAVAAALASADRGAQPSAKRSKEDPVS
ncbi:uncharacterized protein MONBRDRAFT_33553 [Monosiga brevicollis MX1]|uniref:Pre-mRNA-splicing factor cwc2 n=1 Tax=Monosiga brevicollis TaxID=81824 RepID=A9V616_MONBE|nr:uncharacterized protein MONBRDRAFT_33553 [Monosiga brevicollis MX1]EDQ86907.1 predicted protein [Monosiga brevicollis MX1]|eukprot:XP_001748146.1 hypothetical protein [Monosiga brevicollis MX1]